MIGGGIHPPTELVLSESLPVDMAGQIQALFWRAHARMVLPRPMYCGVRKFRGRPAATPIIGLRPYDDIPKSSTFANLNEVSVRKVAQKLMKSAAKYGTLFRESIELGSAEELVVCDPDDLKMVFSAEGKWPIRPEGGTWLKEAKEANEPQGFAQSNGDLWYHRRKPVAKSMTAGRIREFAGDVNTITNDLVRSIYNLRDPDTNVVSDVTRLIIRWSFDVLFFITLGKRLEHLPAALSEEFVDEVTKFQWFNEIHNLYFLSDKTRMLPVQEGIHRMFSTCLPYIKEMVQESDKRKNEETLPQHNYLKNLTDGTLSMQEIVMNTLDVILAGARSVSMNIAWCLYLLAREPIAQERLHKELHGAISMDEPSVTPSHINHMPYLKGCFNEVLRLYGSPWYFQRIIQEDVALSGYYIPENTSTFIPLTVIGRLPQFFTEPQSFMPERWSKENGRTRPSFAFLPFGFGPRVCPGRHIAELQMYVALAQLMRRFQVEFLEETPMDSIQMFVDTVPERQLNLVFKDL